jgi:hypothetical protein
MPCSKDCTSTYLFSYLCKLVIYRDAIEYLHTFKASGKTLPENVTAFSGFSFNRDAPA